MLFIRLLCVGLILRLQLLRCLRGLRLPRTHTPFTLITTDARLHGLPFGSVYTRLVVTAVDFTLFCYTRYTDYPHRLRYIYVGCLRFPVTHARLPVTILFGLVTRHTFTFDCHGGCALYLPRYTRSAFTDCYIYVPLDYAHRVRFDFTRYVYHTVAVTQLVGYAPPRARYGLPTTVTHTRLIAFAHAHTRWVPGSAYTRAQFTFPFGYVATARWVAVLVTFA